MIHSLGTSCPPSDFLCGERYLQSSLPSNAWSKPSCGEKGLGIGQSKADVTSSPPKSHPPVADQNCGVGVFSSFQQRHSFVSLPSGSAVYNASNHIRPRPRPRSSCLVCHSTRIIILLHHVIASHSSHSPRARRRPPQSNPQTKQTTTHQIATRT